MKRAAELARSFACIAAIAIAVVWLRSLPAELGVAATEQLRDAYRFEGADGREHAYLGGFDGYAWAIAARKLERTGSVCDVEVDGDCRDNTSLAPLGRSVHYPHSLHVRAIAALHGVLQSVRPGAPLLEAVVLLPTLVAALAVVPAYALGFRLAGGWVGGAIVALLSGFNPLLLRRTLNGDNDVWSYFFPLLLAWLVTEAILARRSSVSIGCAAVAGAAVGPYATIWNGWPFAWTMATIGLVANAVLIGVVRLTRASDEGAAKWRRAVFSALVFVFTAGVATELADASPSYLDALPLLLNNRLLSAPAEAATGPPLAWPDPYAAVGELRSIGLGEVAVWLGGRVHLFAGWIGLLLMLLPRREWRPQHFATFVVGIVLYRLLFSIAASPESSPSRLLLVGLLAAPLFAAIVLYAIDARDGARRRACISIVAWFAAALFLSLGSVRFMLLLVPPFAVAIAVGIDRLRGLVFDGLATSSGVPRVLAAVSIGAAVAAALYAPLRAGWTVARDYMPQVNDAWYAVLSELRDTTPPDAIVSTWWSYGYFAGYFAERRVTADGGTLYSSAPYWLARAMMARGSDSAGILRMLHCGGVARGMHQPAPPIAPMLAAGLSEPAAMAALDAVFGLDESLALIALRDRGVSDEAALAVLAKTHCGPPPTYVVFSDLDGRDLSWQRMATWNFARAHAATSLPDRDADAITGELAASFSLESAPARGLVAAASAAMRAGRLSEFPSELRAIVPSSWAPCRDVGGVLECGVRSGPITGVELRLDDPAASRLRGAADWGAPSYFAVRLPGDVVERISDGAAGGWGLLFDVETQRALVGNAATLRSTWARLMLLDGVGEELFEKVSADRAAGESVAAWRVRWERLEGPHG